MSITFSGFIPGESVSLRRPSATPGLATVTIETVAAATDGTVTFAAAPVVGAQYQAVAASKRCWRQIDADPVITPGYQPYDLGYSTCPPSPPVADGLQPPIWASVA